MFHKQERKVMAAGSSPLPVALVLTHCSCRVMLKDDMGGKPVLLGHGAGTAALQGVWRWWQSCQKGCSDVGSLGMAHAVLYVPSSAPPTAHVLSGCRHYPSKAGHGLMDTWYDSSVPSYSPTNWMVPREHGKSFQTGKQWPLPSRTGSLEWLGALGEGSSGLRGSTEAMLDFPEGNRALGGVRGCLLLHHCLLALRRVPRHQGGGAGGADQQAR